jgi:hypothetical protein
VDTTGGWWVELQEDWLIVKNVINGTVSNTSNIWKPHV